MSEACVVIRFKMLAYYRVRSAFESNHALSSNIIWGSKTELDGLVHLNHASSSILKYRYKPIRTISYKI